MPGLDDPFWLQLLLKMTASALLVVTASFVVERSGPLAGAMIATLPLSAGPNFAYLAMDHGPAFLAEVARIGMQVNVGNAFFVLAYATVAPGRRLMPALLAGFAGWGGAVIVMRSIDPSLPTTLAISVVVFTGAYLAIRRKLGDERPPPAPRTPFDMPLRAITVMLLVAAVVISGRLAGPSVAGVLAILPLVLSSLVIILHPRIGGASTGQVMLNGFPGLMGFGIAVGSVSVAAIPFGSVIALTGGLVAAVIWNSAVMLIARRRQAHRRITARSGRPS
ncbi:MAG: hypothetical protein JJU21_13785 [Salinarimonas sp.]|nr:hypothetical protein [Salinarimonas sp.]